MSYYDVAERIEAVLLSMVAAGTAELSGVGPHGPTFSADHRHVMERIEAAGLLEDNVPWPYTATAAARMRASPEREQQ